MSRARFGITPDVSAFATRRTRATAQDVRKLSLIGALLLAATGSAHAESLTYVLKPRPALGRLDVQLSWQTAGRSQSGLCVAERWGPLRDVASLITDLRIDGGRLLRHDGACWLIAHKRDALLTVQYAVACRQEVIAWSATHLPHATADRFFGVGATILLVPQTGGSIPDVHDVVLRWDLPRNWRGASTWGIGQSIGDRMRSADLRNAAYLAGPLDTGTTRERGADVSVASAGRFAFDANQLAKVVAPIAADQCEFMRENAFPPLVVTLVPAGEPLASGPAKLHGQGFTRGLALWLAPDADLTEGLEHVIAHELFHHWIGGVLKPAEPSEAVLWYTEGMTDYYALRRLWESGRWNDETLARWLNRHLRGYHANPARNASNNELQARARAEPATYGELAYQRGLLLALRWHRIARDRGVTAGLDALTWHLVQRGRSEGAMLSEKSIRDAGVRVLGPWFADEFDRHVTRGEMIEIPRDALAPRLQFNADSNGGAFGPPGTP